MLLAITTWVRASRWVERAVASSALSASSAIHCSSRTTAGSAPPSTRSCWRKRETKVGVSGGGSEANRSSSRSERGPSLAARPRRCRAAAAVGRLQLVEPLHRAERHPAHVLDQAQPEHGRHRPQLADGEGGDLLEGRDEAGDVVEIDPALGVARSG